MASPLLLVLSYRTHAQIPKSQQRAVAARILITAAFIKHWNRTWPPREAPEQFSAVLF